MTGYDWPMDDVWQPTGHGAVDSLLNSLDTLGESSLEEQVRAFERANGVLRAALECGSSGTSANVVADASDSPQSS
jgi:hypothetical protein